MNNKYALIVNAKNEAFRTTKYFAGINEVTARLKTTSKMQDAVIFHSLEAAENEVLLLNNDLCLAKNYLTIKPLYR